MKTHLCTDVNVCECVCVAENQGMNRVKHYELRSHLQLRMCDLCSPALPCH